MMRHLRSQLGPFAACSSRVLALAHLTSRWDEVTCGSCLRWRPPNVAVPAGTFATIVADFPWRLVDGGSRMAPRYPTMTDSEILRFPLPELAEPNGAHLYLWCLDQHDRLAFALELLRGWSFVVKHTFVWCKIDSRSRARMGGGHYGRKAHELCLFAVRGRLAARTHDQRTWFRARRGEHSRKPDRLYRIAEAMSPPARLELFARRPRPGWTTWGNEL